MTTVRPRRLTAGHRQGLGQLRRYAAGSDGAVRIVATDGEPDEFGLFGVELALDCRQVTHKSGGLKLAAEEHAVVLIPPRFPFQYPLVRVPHLRFADAPHVQWGDQLCLFQAPSMEWEPSAGMLGFLRRLLQWYQRAARAELATPGEPLHPPVAYAFYEAGCVVVHANAPVAPVDGPWLGAALLQQVRPDRADVHDWLDQRRLRRLRPADVAAWELPGRAPARTGPVLLGPSVVLPQPMSFEFPATTARLAGALAAQGLPTDRLVGLFGEVALLNARAGGPGHRQPPPPLYVFVGAPMRGVAGKGPRRTHLAAWQLPVHRDTAPLLGGITLRDSGDPRLATLGQVVSRAVRDWLLDERHRTSWAVVYEQRPEIVTRRDHDSPARWLEDKRVLVLGCGALGAPIAEQCVRAGASHVTVADRGSVNPGILVRQPYEDADIGKAKAQVLADRLGRIRAATVVEAEPGDVLATVLAGDAAPDVHLIVDATANPTVATKLEQLRRIDRDSWPPVASVAIGHRAELGVATLSLPGATGGSLDILRRLGLVTRADPQRRLDDVADDLFPFPPRSELFQPEPGCSEPTFVGSAAQVTALASHLATAILSILATHTPKTPARPMSAYVVRLNTDPEAPSPPPMRLVWDNDLVCHDPTTGYEVRVAAPAVTKLYQECRAARRRFDRTTETGGPLFGEIDDACQVVWVSEAREPPSDSSASRGHFDLGVAGMKRLTTRFDLATAGSIRFVGAWHTHPDGQARESDDDQTAMDKIVHESGEAPHQALLMILGGVPVRWSAWLENGKPPDTYVRLVERTARLTE